MTFPTAADLGRKLRDGSIDAVSLTEATIETVKSCGDPALFIEVFEARALAEAKAARKRLRAGTPASLLDGIPVAWKDLFDFKGRVTTAGSIVLKSDPPARQDAALAAAGRRAGLVAIGSVNMTEFAYSGIGLNPHYGTPRNPNGSGPARSPGGSSSGSGVAVAKGIVPLAIGTDTGGSIRIPASFNGVVGYKSSTGHYPMDGVFPLSRTLDSLGPLARSVQDCVLADAVLTGRTRPRSRKRPVKGLTFIVPTNVVFDGCEEAVAANFDAALSRIAKAGAKVRHMNIPAFDEILELNQKRGILLGAEALHLHWDRVHGPDADRMDARVVRRIRMAETMTAVDLVAVLDCRRRLIAECNAQMGDGILAFPTTPNVAMDIAPLAADQDQFFRANARTLRNTMLGNFLDWCGLAIPSGYDHDNMPTSFLLSARHGLDTELLSAGLSIEPLVNVREP